jgi:gentisate 1,2-dioxygenase
MWSPRSAAPVVGHQHVNLPAEPAVLFSLDDARVLRALGLYREEELE